jgi:murein L,D-transpeptidase YafK
LRWKPLSLVLVIGLGLAACEENRPRGAARHNIPIPADVQALMSVKGMNKSSPVLIRSFKKESELEIWKMAGNGQYALLKSYPMCRWSGQLGPKKREGDRQAPEGFYDITPASMNPNSSFYLSFNMGFPNAFDRTHGRTGAHLMVHGACSSAGCYSMSDDQIAEIYAIVREAHNGGQRAVQMQAMPFRMSAENLAKHRYDANMPFWRNLKEGSDMFEVARVEPKVSVCQARYAFNRTGDCREDPTKQQIAASAAEKRRQDEAQVAALVARGTPAIRLVYQDGGQHDKFTQVLMASGPEALEQKAAWGSRAVGVSRPDAVISGPQEIMVASPGSVTPRPATAAAPASTVSAGTSSAVTASAGTSSAGTALAPATTTRATVLAATARAGSAQPGNPSTGTSQVARGNAAAPPAAAPEPAAQPSMMQRMLSFSPFSAAQPAAEAPAPAPVAVTPPAGRATQSAPPPPRRADGQNRTAPQAAAPGAPSVAAVQ